MVAGEYTPEKKIAQLGSFAEPMSFLDLARGFPADRLRAQMAYAQSASVVSFLFREHGQESLHILIEEMSQGHALDVALVRATGLTPQELDVAWRGSTFQVPMWLRSLSVDGTLIALVGVMVLLGSVRKYKQYRSGRPHWDEEERIHQQLVRSRHLGHVHEISLNHAHNHVHSGKTTFLDLVQHLTSKWRQSHSHHNLDVLPDKDGHQLGRLAPNLTVGQDRLLFDQPIETKPV